MLNLLWLIPVLPMVGFLVLATTGRRMTRTLASLVGCGSIGLSALLACTIATRFISSPPEGYSYTQQLWTWMAAGDFRADIALFLDPLSLLMILVVTVVGFFIHVYSTEYMADDEGFSRFFAYMNLFVAAMLILVLGRNLLLLYLGWEGVGLCSFLLIGFWYSDRANTAAARKAFIVTRVGDTFMAIGLFLLAKNLGTLDIPELMHRATTLWPVGSSLAVASAALLLGGAVGKSAQLPLQTWLPDAMAGPTPTSALIHAATMVTAGVYLIARTHSLFLLAPSVMAAVAVIGAATMLLASFSALVQSDIKRILAYSTVSQIGYMFLALGVGAWSAAMFHFMTHAFFKALLFLAAGSVIVSLHHEQDICKMGGLRRQIPLAYWSFVIGGCALAGLPVVTAGFFSKDLIIWSTVSSERGSVTLWAIALIGALMTAVYTFRLIFIVFHGQEQSRHVHKTGVAIAIPLVVLCALSIVGGYINVPEHFGGSARLSAFLQHTLPAAREAHEESITENMTMLAASLMFIIGAGVAWMLYGSRRSMLLPDPLRRFWAAGWGFDWIYDKLFVKPVFWLARVLKGDYVDSVFAGMARLARGSYALLAWTQTGRLRWYASGMAAGAALLVLLVILR